jgi:hypothetical protein
MGYQYVPAKTNHLLHWILCLFTLGLWFPVYILVALHNHGRMVLKQLPDASPLTPGYHYSSGQWSPYHPPQK